MKKTLLIAILCVLIPSLVLAKKVKKEEVVAVEEPAEQVDETIVTEECLMNVSLFNESCKNKQYAEAGADILGWKIEQTTDPAERKALVDLLMQMYDKRIKYFGDDPKYPVHYILGLKGVDYCNYCTDDALKLPAYEWLKTAIEKLGSSSQLTMIQKFNEVSSNLYKSDPSKYWQAWQEYTLSPMAANVQLIFYRPISTPLSPSPDSILVRILLNEHETLLDADLKPTDGCFYRWSDLRSFWSKQIVDNGADGVGTENIQ